MSGWPAPRPGLGLWDNPRIGGPSEANPRGGRSMVRFAPLWLALIAGSASARAEIVSRPVEYQHGSTPLVGMLVYDSAGAGKRPGVLLAHEQGASGKLALAKAG